MTKRIKIRLAEPDDEIYSNGIIVGGWKVLPPTKDSAVDEKIDQRSREDDHETYEIMEDDD